MAECQLPKLDVAGSNPVGRSKNSGGYGTTRGPLVVSGHQMVTMRRQMVRKHVPASGRQITSNSSADATRWVQYSHYSLLATVEAIFNLGTFGRNDTSATPMSDLFRGGIP